MYGTRSQQRNKNTLTADTRTVCFISHRTQAHAASKWLEIEVVSDDVNHGERGCLVHHGVSC